MSRVVPALAVTFAIQALLSAGIFAPPVLASVAQHDIGVAASYVGVFTCYAYVAAALTSLVSASLIARLGPIAVSQCCLLASAAGLVCVASASVPLVIVGALLIGGAYGPATPASSVILLAVAPARVRATILSIKQTAVPFGGVAVGICIPVVTVTWGWARGAQILALCCVILAMLCETVRRRVDVRDASSRVGRIDTLEPLRLAREHRSLRKLSIVAFLCSGVQLCFATYLVVYLVEQGGYTLVDAGIGMSVFMLAGIVGRVVWGVIADHMRRGLAVLAVLGLGSGGIALTFTLIGPHWPLSAVLGLCFFAGFTAIAWNGVQLAEVARRAPEGRIAVATGMTMMFSYFGVVVAPLLFWVMYTLSGGYPAGFILSACFSAMGSMLLLRR